MDTILAARLEELQAHLSAVTANPTEVALDERLLDWVGLHLTAANLPPLLPTLLPQVLRILPELQQDPEPLTLLIIRLLRPLNFDESIQYTDPAALVVGLQSPWPSVNTLALTLLEKAQNASDAAIVAGMKDVVKELVRLWLSTDWINVSEAALKVLTGLLRVDCAKSAEQYPDEDIDMGDNPHESKEERPRGQGLLWRRLLEDRDVYGQLYTLTNKSLARRERTLAQSRLLSFIPPLVALDYNAILRPHIVDIEEHSGLRGGVEGLLDYAAVIMVDTRDDVLMHMTLMDFYSELLKIYLPVSPGSSPIPGVDSETLNFLISRGLHQRTINYYLPPFSEDLDGVEKSFLLNRSAHYLATYASRYPQHILAAQEEDGTTLISRILAQIIVELPESDSSASRRKASATDLHLLTSLPRVAILPKVPAHEQIIPEAAWHMSPISHIPQDMADEDTIKTLAALFHGPLRESNESDQQWSTARRTSAYRDLQASEAAASRALFLLYIDHNPNLFENIVKTAQIVALKDAALAAIGLISSVLTAKWGQLPTAHTNEESSFLYPMTERQLRLSVLYVNPSRLPATGVAALTSPPAMAAVLPYLCSPPQTFNNIVGGGRGDVESAAYRVALAKHDALQKLYHAMKGEGMEGPTLEIVKEAVARGPWAPEPEPNPQVVSIDL